MSVYDDIETIGNAAKNDIIISWYRYISLKISERSMCQHFHAMTGHNENIDTIEWYVNKWLEMAMNKE